MRIQAVVTPSSPEPPTSFSDQDARETMAVVQRVIEDTGADTDTFCKWLMSSRVRVDGPLSGICHWFTHPDRSQSRGQVTRYHAGDADTLDIVHRSGFSSGLQDSASISISIIMILATVLFILLVTAFVTCIIRKKRRPQASVESGGPAPAVVRKDKPPDYNSVLKMKELEEEGLPSYTQATQADHLP